jgi:hypothetical protein
MTQYDSFMTSLALPEIFQDRRADTPSVLLLMSWKPAEMRCHNR